MIRIGQGHVCFVGGGAMGCYNAILSALGGHKAVIHDVSDAVLAAVPASLSETATHLVDAGLINASDIEAALTEIQTESDLRKALEGAWLVSESVFEDIALKRRLFSDIEQACDDDVLITTNSSALLVSDMDSALDNGQRFAALHSHLGAMLFDIVGGPRTSPTTISRLKDYVLSLGGYPLVQHKENKGYVFNAMIGPVLSTALYLAATGAETIHGIDRAWMLRTGSPMGPFGMIDLFGLGLIYSGWHKRDDDPAIREMRQDILSFLSPILGSGRLGLRSGAGFYNYPAPRYSMPDFLERQPKTSSADHALTSAWTQNAVLLAANQIATPTDIDRAWMVATRQSRGPFAVLDEIGLDRAFILFSATGPFVPTEDHSRLLEYLGRQIASSGTGAGSGSGFYTYPAPIYAAEEFLSMARVTANA